MEIKQLKTGALTDVLPRNLHLVRAIDVGESAQAEALVVRRIAVAVDEQRRLGRLEDFSDALSQLVVRDAAPVLGLLINDRLRSFGV